VTDSNNAAIGRRHSWRVINNTIAIDAATDQSPVITMVTDAKTPRYDELLQVSALHCQSSNDQGVNFGAFGTASAPCNDVALPVRGQ
jgi:hypothetical protein